MCSLSLITRRRLTHEGKEHHPWVLHVSTLSFPRFNTSFTTFLHALCTIFLFLLITLQSFSAALKSLASLYFDRKPVHSAHSFSTNTPNNNNDNNSNKQRAQHQTIFGRRHKAKMVDFAAAAAVRCCWKLVQIKLLLRLLLLLRI